MTLFKGRFRGGLHPDALNFSSSLAVDSRLFREDIEGSLAHVAMLSRRRIIPAAEARRIAKALKEILAEVGAGRASWLRASGRKKSGRLTADDIHMAIERRLIEKVGEIGGKLHTARSRNDQIALDERLWLRGEIDRLTGRTRALQRALVKAAKKNVGVLMPGYTHLQRAQPILLAHHLLAYVEMLERDVERFTACRTRANRSPLGAGALAGTSFPLDRAQVARRLGMDGLVGNSIDAVADRDFLIEFLAAAAITMMHLSRMAEELVLWSSQEWSFIELGDDVTTGSSIMPQKKNPDMAELVRGKTGRVYGSLMALLTTMKGLPLAYNRDMQEDKEPLFDTAATLDGSLRMMALMYGGMKVNAHRFEDEAGHDAMLATELADYLVRKGMPFRKAHGVVGSIVRRCAEEKIALKELPLKTYRNYSALFGDDITPLLDMRVSLTLKKSQGSTSPRQVANALHAWERKLGKR